MARIPVRDFEFPEPSSEMFHLVCANHPEMEYLTKNPYMRSLQFISHVWPECPCPFTDLIVLTDEDSRYNKENAS